MPRNVSAIQRGSGLVEGEEAEVYIYRNAIVTICITIQYNNGRPEKLHRLHVDM